MKRALVIGGTGFVGLNLVDELLSQGVEVRCTRRRRSVTVYLRKRDVELADAELTDAGTLGRAMEGCDVVFYTAAPYPRYSFDLKGATGAAAEAAQAVVTAAQGAGVRRVVFTSSTGLLDPALSGRWADPSDIPIQAPTDSVYRASKWATHHRFVEARRSGLAASSVLAGGCLGPWDVRAGTGGLLLALLRAAMPWYTDGLVHLVDVRDVARAHVAAAHEDVAATDYCLPGHSLLLSAVLSECVQRYGGEMPGQLLGAARARVQADLDEAEASKQCGRVPFPREMVDIVSAGQPVEGATALRELGIELTPLWVATEAAHAWFLRHGYLPKPRVLQQENESCQSTRP